ncbi:hypothetical protein J7E49_06920 [Variovorax paradoxus]|nr:hypothetical protein [Variovorax paradoxus]
MEGIFITLHAAASVVCWFITAAGATVAVFSRRIEDTVTERIGLAAIAIGATGTGCRIITQGWISEGGLFLSMALAGYVLAVFVKHWRGVRGSNADKGA